VNENDPLIKKLLASSKQKSADKTQAAREKAQARDRKIKQSMAVVAAMPEGQMILRLLKDWCGYQSTSTTADPTSTDVLLNSTIYNEAQRNIYLRLRKHMSRLAKIKIEIDDADLEEFLSQ